MSIRGIGTPPTSKRGAQEDAPIAAGDIAAGRCMGHVREMDWPPCWLVDVNGLSIRLKLTEGHAPDGSSAADPVETLQGRQILLAGVPAIAMRCASALRRKADVKPISQRRVNPAFSAFLYQRQNIAESFFSKLGQFQRSLSASKNTTPIISRPSNSRRQISDAIHEALTLLVTKHGFRFLWRYRPSWGKSADCLSKANAPPMAGH